MKRFWLKLEQSSAKVYLIEVSLQSSDNSLRSLSLARFRYFKNNRVLDQVKTQKLLGDKQDKKSIEKSVETYC